MLRNQWRLFHLISSDSWNVIGSSMWDFSCEKGKELITYLWCRKIIRSSFFWNVYGKEAERLKNPMLNKIIRAKVNSKHAKTQAQNVHQEYRIVDKTNRIDECQNKKVNFHFLMGCYVLRPAMCKLKIQHYSKWIHFVYFSYEYVYRIFLLRMQSDSILASFVWLLIQAWIEICFHQNFTKTILFLSFFDASHL